MSIRGIPIFPKFHPKIIYGYRNHHLQAMKNDSLSVIEREVLERQLAPNQLREHQEEQTDRPNSQNEDSHNNTPPAAARSYEAEGNIEYLHKIKEWMQLGSERTRIPSLKTYPSTKRI